jgi:ribosomal protein L37E
MADKRGQAYQRTRPCSLNRIIQIREYAIKNLSKLSLSSVEKVALARAHKVSKWLKEGLTEILAESPIPPLDELEKLGLKTACRLLWIWNQRVSTNASTQGLQVTLRSIGCYNSNCQAALFVNFMNCRACGRQIAVDDPEAMYFFSNCSVTILDRGTPGPGRGALIFNSQYLRCRHCANYPINPQNYPCTSCGQHTSYSNFRLISPASLPNPSTNPSVDEVFEEEITSYESWDQ